MHLRLKSRWHLAGSLLAVLASLSSSRAADERFGVMAHFAHGWDPVWIGPMAEAGLTQVRDEIYWDAIESKKGIFTFPPAYDRYMAGLAARKISPLIILSFENKNYDDNNTPYTAEGFAAYARYAVEVLRHYGPQIKAVEIWNEYNGSFARGPAANDRARTYRKMLEVVYTAIKRERPDVTVVGGGTAGIPLPYWEKLMKSGALPFMDAISVHPYRYGLAPEGLEDEIDALQELVRTYNNGKDKPVWVTETGWYLKTSQAVGDPAIDEAEQARFLVRGYALLLSAGVEKIYWYLLRDYQGLAMGLLADDAARRPKAAYFALATMSKQLADARFVRRENSPDDLYSLVFQRNNGEQVRVLWSLAPRELTLTGVTGLVDLAGKSVAFSKTLTVDESPVFVSGNVAGIPPEPKNETKMLADSARDFPLTKSSTWSYGCFVGAGTTTFTPLTVYEVTDWKASWTASYPYLLVSADEQHPSVSGSNPVTSVRRWRSDYTGSVTISGTFRCTTNGDGVGASVLVDGKVRFRKLLGGTGGAVIVENFDFVEKVQPGTVIDFGVDPGPGTNINYDATAVSVVISTAP